MEIKKMVLADDSPLVRDLAMQHMAQTHGQINFYTSPDSQKLRQLTDMFDFDVVVLDHGVPGYEGMHDLQRLRQSPRYKNTPIVILSAREIGDIAVKNGATGFVNKINFINDALDVIIRKYLPDQYRSDTGLAYVKNMYLVPNN